jgi:hypothetical protein
MQIKITEHNDWEGETFNYIIDVTPNTLSLLELGLKNRENVTITKNTEYTPEAVEILNKESDNSYMAAYGFYKIKTLPTNDFDYYEDVIYKGKGLELIKK